MKDAKGHGSNTRGGAHASKVNNIGLPNGFRTAAPAEFLAARNQSAHMDMFTPHEDPNELAQHTLILRNDGKVGSAVSPTGDVQSVFNNSGERGAGGAAIEAAKAAGGKTLDAFDGKLPSIYKQHGFVEDRREKNWTPGGPDVVYMKLKGK
jgi:PPE-repeat protein